MSGKRKKENTKRKLKQCHQLPTLPLANIECFYVFKTCI